MRYRRLGRTGLKVSEVSLGAMAFGRWIGESESAEVLEAALDAGINLIDTADVYGRGMDLNNPLLTGESEEILGRLLQGKRDQVVLATKVNGRVGNGVNDAGLSRYHIIRAVENACADCGPITSICIRCIALIPTRRWKKRSAHWMTSCIKEKCAISALPILRHGS